MKTDFNTVNSAGLPKKMQERRHISRKKPPILQFLAKCFVDRRRFSTFVRRLANGHPELTSRTITCEQYPSCQKTITWKNLIHFLFARLIHKRTTISRIDLMVLVNT